MELNEKLEIHLDKIKQLKGIKSVVLIHRDGNPIRSVGNSFSRDKFLDISAIIGAIFNIGYHLHPDDLNHILLEGKRITILIAPLSPPVNPLFKKKIKKTLLQQGLINMINEFFIVITAQPGSNLLEIIQNRNYLGTIRTTLITSGESFKPTVSGYEESRNRHISKHIKKNTYWKAEGLILSSNFSENIKKELESLLWDFSTSIPYANVIVDGEFMVSKHSNEFPQAQYDKNLEQTSIMSYTLYQFANMCLRILKKKRRVLIRKLLKKTLTHKVLLDCENSVHIIYGLGKATLSTEISKKSPKLDLDLINLPVSQSLEKICVLIKKASKAQGYMKLPKSLSIE